MNKELDDRIQRAYEDFVYLKNPEKGTLGLSERTAFLGVVRQLLRELNCEQRRQP
jgi:hypothetical protein